MDWLKVTEKLRSSVVKYRYALIVLSVGIILMLWPGKSESQTQPVPTSEELTESTGITQELSQILEQIRGVGKVRIMLTVAAGEMMIYQYDEDLQKGETGSVKTETVIVTDGQRNEKGLIRQVNPPEYRGAIVVCQGGDQPSVCLAVVDAVSKVTGLSSDRISVLKMK